MHMGVHCMVVMIHYYQHAYLGPVHDSCMHACVLCMLWCMYCMYCMLPVSMSHLGGYRESSHGTKELFNLSIPPLVLKTRHLSGSAFCLIDIGLPVQAVGGFPLGSGLVVE